MPRSPEAIEWATSYPIFHWGVTGWAFYCLPALAISYAYFCRGTKSMRLSDNCRAVIGDHADGALGKVIDLLFMLGLLGAAGTGIGLAVPLISNGLSQLLGVADSFQLDLAVVLAVTAVFAASVYAGLERGIRRLSNTNVALTFVLLLFVLIAGPTRFILEVGTSAVGHGLQDLPPSFPIQGKESPNDGKAQNRDHAHGKFQQSILMPVRPPGAKWR